MLNKYFPYIMIGTFGGMLGWFALRAFAQKKVAELIMAEYDALNEIGPILATADSDYIVVSTDRYAVKVSVDNLLKSYLPIIGWNIPTEPSLLDFLSYRLAVPTKLPQNVIRKLLDEVMVWVRSPTSEDYAKDKGTEVLVSLGILKP